MLGGKRLEEVEWSGGVGERCILWLDSLGFTLNNLKQVGFARIRLTGWSGLIAVCGVKRRYATLYVRESSFRGLKVHGYHQAPRRGGSQPRAHERIK